MQPHVRHSEKNMGFGVTDPWGPTTLGTSLEPPSPCFFTHPTARIRGRAEDAPCLATRCENTIVTAALALIYARGLFKVEWGLRVRIGAQRRFGFKLAFALVILSFYCSSNLYL